MPKGTKLKSPEDPEEKIKLYNRRKKNKESAQKHRLGQKRKIEDGENYQKLLKEAEERIAILENENKFLTSQLNIGKCPCCIRSTNHVLPVVAYQSAPSSAPIHYSNESRDANYMIPSEAQPYHSFSDSCDSGTDEAFHSPHPVFPPPQNGWIDNSYGNASAYPQGSNQPLTYTELGAYNTRGDSYVGYGQSSAINAGAATTVVPSIKMPNRAAPVPSMRSTSQMVPHPACLNKMDAHRSDVVSSTVPPQQSSNYVEEERRPDFWTAKFPLRNSVRAVTPAQEKNSPLTDILLKCNLPKEMPVLADDFVKKTLSPSFDKMSVRG